MKSVTMYRPNTIESALNDFDRYFESFFGDSALSPAVRMNSRPPAVDVRETEKAYELEMELPGYDEKDIEVHVDGRNLTIASKQEDSREEKNGGKDEGKGEGTYILRERRVRTFNRSFKLPENASVENVTAEFKNGVLKLEIEKRAEAQKRLIRINKN